MESVLRDINLPVVLHILTLAVKLIEKYKLPFWKMHVDNIHHLLKIIMSVIFIENTDVRVCIFLN